MATPLTEHVAVQAKYDRVLRKTLLDAAAEAERIVKAGGKEKFTKTRMRRAQADLQKLILDTYGETEKITVAGQKEAARRAALSERWMQGVLKKTYGAEMPGWDKALGYSAENGISALMARQANAVPLARSVYRAAAYSTGAVGAVVNRGLVLQKSAAEIAKDVRGMVNPSTPGGVSYAAQRLARTEINNAFHAQQIASRSSEPWTEGFIWNLSGSHRVPDECNAYSENSVRGREAGFFAMADVPAKPHPNCFCYLTTATISEEDFINSFSKGKYDAKINEALQETEPEVINISSASKTPSKPRNTLKDWSSDAKTIGAHRDPFQSDPVMRKMAEVQGYDANPDVIKRSQVAGRKVLYRGIASADMDRHYPAQELVDRFISGEYFAGRGMYGNGTYTSSEKSVTDNYVANDGVVLEMVLKKDAKTIKINDLKALIVEAKADPELRDVMRGLGGDPGRFAIMLGYDAIEIPDLNYFNILNRAAVEVIQ